MADYQACIDAIKTAGRGQLDDDEVMSLLETLQSYERYLKATKTVVDSSEAALKAAEEIANRVKIAAIIEKRNAAINLVKRVERGAWIQKNFGNNLVEGFEALLVGVNRAKQGSRESVAQVQKTLRDTYLAGFVNDIEHTGHLSMLNSGSMDRDIARALWAFGKEDEAAQLGKLPKEAVDVARVIHKWQEVSRIDANKSGAWIGKLDGYITRQSHDAEKIRGRGTSEDYQRWEDDAINYFDIPQMIINNEVVDPKNMLTGLWNDLASGNHLRVTPKNEISGFKGPANVAKKLSQGRTIVFRDADAWFDYNQKYGTGNLRESVVSGLEHSANSIGLMKVLGTNPKSMLETIKGDLIDNAKKAGNVNLVADLDAKRGKLDNYMSAVDGSMNIPGNALWARRSANIRSWITLSKLGGMVLSQLNDIAVYGSGARYQGRGFFEGMREATTGLGRSLKDPEKRDLAAALGVVLDNMAAEIGRTGTFAESGGMAKATQLFMKLNLSKWWTERMRTSAAFGMSHHMALQASKTWDQIGAEYQRMLSLYNIDSGKWDVIRSANAKHVDGKEYIVPEALRVIDDSSIAAYVTSLGKEVTENSIKFYRDEIEGNLRNYFVDQTSVLALEPDAKTRAILLQGTRPGTWIGEMMRFVMQFKSFTGAYMQRIIGRELYGRGYEGDSVLGALRAGNGEFIGLAQLIAISTVMGYGSLALKDLAKGKTPRNPAESPEMGLKVMFASLVQGGGAGIYGDFLFGAASRMGSGTVETLAGPTISSAGRIVDLYHKAMEGDKFAARAFNELLNNTPFMNLFYTRMALDYMVFHRIQETMSPGYLRRKERDAEKNNAQTFYIKPSETLF